MKILNYLKKHKFFVGFLLFALCFSCFSSHLIFADDRLLIGSFNASNEPVQLVVANVNSPMSSVLATAANQTVSSHSDDSHYNYLSGAQFLDYISYCGLDFLSSHSAKWFYDNDLFVNYYGYSVDNFVYLSFVFSKSNFVSQPIEWKTIENTGDQVFYDNSFYFVPSSGSFFFSPCWDNVVYQSSSFFSSLQYFSLSPFSKYNSNGSLVSRNNNTSLSTFIWSSSAYNTSFHNFDSDIESFMNNYSTKFFSFTFLFSLDNYNNSTAPIYVIGNNYAYFPYALFPLASSFYSFDFNTDSYNIYTSTSTNSYTYQFQKLPTSLAVSFPFVKSSGALAYENDFALDPTATPTPFPTYEPWDPNNPAGGSTPTPIPSGFGGITPTPIPSVSPPPATVTPINIFYNPVIDNGSDIWGTVQSIFNDFNAFFLNSQFIKFCSSLMNNVFYFDTHFIYFVIPVYICFIMFLIGRFRRK